MSLWEKKTDPLSVSEFSQSNLLSSGSGKISCMIKSNQMLLQHQTRTLPVFIYPPWSPLKHFPNTAAVRQSQSARLCHIQLRPGCVCYCFTSQLSFSFVTFCYQLISAQCFHCLVFVVPLAERCVIFPCLLSACVTWVCDIMPDSWISACSSLDVCLTPPFASPSLKLLLASASVCYPSCSPATLPAPVVTITISH